MKEHCPWCLRNSIFNLLEESKLSQKIYVCCGCGKQAVQCGKLDCLNLAKTTEVGKESFCVEHHDAAVSFNRPDKVLVEISEFESIFKDRSSEKKYTAAAKVAVAGASLLFPAASVLSKVALAGAEGLRTAGRYIASRDPHTKNAIDDSRVLLEGDAFSGGVTLSSATGIYLGTKESRRISNAYFREIDHFNIRRVKSGDDHGVIFINGFLSQLDSDTEVWEKQFAQQFLHRSWYHLDWEASSLKRLGIHLSDSKNGATDLAAGLAKTVADLSFNFLTVSLFDIAKNPWHASMVKAQMAGVLLADAIARTPHQKFTLVGHSLGARVIYFALKSLSSRPKVSVEDAFLLGGAVGGGEKDSKGWSYAEKSVRGRIYNCLSKRDSVLEYVYTNANLQRSDPIGYAGIARKSEKILNIDCSDLVDSHTSWRQNFGQIHRRIAEMG